YIGDAVDKPPAAPKWLDRRSAGMPPAGAEGTSEHQSQPRKTTDVYSTELYKSQERSVVSRSEPDALSQDGAVTLDYQEPIVWQRSQTGTRSGVTYPAALASSDTMAWAAGHHVTSSCH